MYSTRRNTTLSAALTRDIYNEHYFDILCHSNEAFAAFVPSRFRDTLLTRRVDTRRFSKTSLSSRIFLNQATDFPWLGVTT